MNDKWRGYVSALDELALKLSTSYNIETIIAPLDVQISEAIMNFQENGPNISEQVFQTCAVRSVPAPSYPSELQPGHVIRPANHKLVKRAAKLAPVATNPLNSHNSNHNRHISMHQPTNMLTLRKEKVDHLSPPFLLEDLTSTGQKSPLLIDEIRNYMLSTKSFWHNLPHAVCTSNQTLGTNNSLTLGRNQKQTNCFQDSFQLGDLNSDVRHWVDMQQQVNQLDVMRQKILSALVGNEIEWSFKPENKYQPSGGKVPSTTTTTTTTPEPFYDEGTDYGPDDNLEGSGVSEPGSEGAEEPEDTTVTEDYESTIDGESETTPESPSATSSESPAPIETEPNIKIDPPSLNDIPNTLITPPEERGAQKSSQTSTKLVISIESHTLLGSLLSVALLIVIAPYFSNQRMIPHIHETR